MTSLMALHDTHNGFWYFFRCYKNNTLSWHTSNFESVNKRPLFIRIADVCNIPKLNKCEIFFFQEYNLITCWKKSVTSLYKGKMSIVTVFIPSPTMSFLKFLEGQAHKENKLGNMTNVGKNRLVKAIFTNIHKISDACASSFGRYIMIAQCMRNVFTFY